MQAARHESAETVEHVAGTDRLAAKEESGEDVAQTCVMEAENWMPGVMWEKEERVPQNCFHCEGEDAVLMAYAVTR